MIGIPTANRTREELEGIVGFFVNTLPLLLHLAGNPSYLALQQHVHERALDAFAHQELPFELIVQALHLERHLGYTPLSQVLFTLQNWPQAPLELPGLHLTSPAQQSWTARCDLSLELTPLDGYLEGRLEYSTDLFTAATIHQFIDHFQRLLRAIVAQPHQAISHLPLLSRAEEHLLLETWNATRRAFPAGRWTHEMCEKQVERTPAALALVCGEQQLTYQALNQRANQLAQRLQAAGVRPESVVGVCLQPSPELVVCLLAILKAGAAYIPLDPAYPLARLSAMVDDARPEVLVTCRALQAQIHPLAAWTRQVLILDAPAELLPVGNPASHSQAESLAYVIYTSGSTGTPKGVGITHQGLHNLVCWHLDTFALTTQDRTSQFASLSFDAAGWEI